MAKKISQEEAQKLLIAEVVKEVTKYEKGQFWITDKVAFNMREMIKQFRKNYWGIYDDPTDNITGEERLWVPLTRTLVDAVRKNINIDPKHVRFRSINPRKARAHITHLVRGFTRQWLSNIYFNHILNQTTFTTAVDGTDVWKTYTENGKVIRKDVDLLNVYIDPTADSIQDAYRFTERVLMTRTEMNRMDWENTNKFKVQEDLEKEDGDAAKKTGEFGDVYESWGFYPKHLVLAAAGLEYSEQDEMEELESQVVISGIDTGHVLFHFAGENTTKDKLGNVIKPYEEAWYIKVPGRWYGIGIAETIMRLQEWINTIVNLRIKKNTMAQLGLLKVRRGSKVTQQMLKNLVSKGVIELADPDRDLTQLQIAEAGASSYNDEEVARRWAQDVTAVFDSALGDLPASTSATGAVIQDKQQRSAFQLITESMEHFVQRWMDRHVLPNIPEMIKSQEYVTFFRDFEDVQKLREAVVASLAMEKLNKSGTRLPSEQELVEEMNKAMRKLESQGDLFFEVIDEIIAEGLETEVFMTNAEIDVATTVRNLIELRGGMDQQAAAEMTAEAMDLLGLEVPQALRSPLQSQPQQPANVAPQATPTEQSIVTEANVLNSEQR